VSSGKPRILGLRRVLTKRTLTALVKPVVTLLALALYDVHQGLSGYRFAALMGYGYAAFHRLRITIILISQD